MEKTHDHKVKKAKPFKAAAEPETEQQIANEGARLAPPTIGLHRRPNAIQEEEEEHLLISETKDEKDPAQNDSASPSSNDTSEPSAVTSQTTTSNATANANDQSGESSESKSENPSPVLISLNPEQKSEIQGSDDHDDKNLAFKENYLHALASEPPPTGEEDGGSKNIADSSFQLGEDIRFEKKEKTTPDQKESYESSNANRLPEEVRTELERISGYDLSKVEVHTDSKIPDELNAKGVAQEQKIFFGSGEVDLSLLVHEAWHVVQYKQGKVDGSPQKKSYNVNNDSALEKEADYMGEKLSSQMSQDSYMNPSASGSSITGQLKSDVPLQLNTTPTDAEYKTYDEIMDMTVSEFKTYADRQADWHASTDLDEAQCDEIRPLLAEIRNRRLNRGMGEVKMEELRDEKTSQGEKIFKALEYFCDAHGTLPFTLSPSNRIGSAGKTLQEGIDIGLDLVKLRTEFGDVVLERALQENDFFDLVTHNLIDDVITYHAATGAFFESENPTWNDFSSYKKLRIDDNYDPMQVHNDANVSPYVRNYHRFTVDALKALKLNFADKSKSKPLTLILHSAVDHNGAFHRDPNFDAVLTNTNINAIMIEGGTSVGHYTALIPAIAQEYGINDQIDQVMISGHGNDNSIELAGNVNQDATSTDDVMSVTSLESGQWNEDGSYTANQPDADNETNQLFDAILDNMDLDSSGDARNSNRRILFNACLTNSNQVRSDLSADNPGDAARQITDFISQNPSLATYMQQRIDARGGTNLDSIGGNGSYGSEATLIDPSGRLNLASTEDPELSSPDKWAYMNRGTNPLGAIRAALECWAEDRTRCIGEMRNRGNATPSAAWKDILIIKSYKRVVDNYSTNGEAFNRMVNVVGTLEEMKSAAHLNASWMYIELANAPANEDTKYMVGFLKSSTQYGASNVVKLGMNELDMFCNYNVTNTGATNFMSLLGTNFNCSTALEYVHFDCLEGYSVAEPLMTGAFPEAAKLRLALLAVLKQDSPPQYAVDYLMNLINAQNEFSNAADVNTALGGYESEDRIRMMIGAIPSPDEPSGSSGPTNRLGNVRHFNRTRNTFYITPMTTDATVKRNATAIYRIPDIASPRIGQKNRGDILHVIGQSIYFYAFEHAHRGQMGTAYIRKTKVDLS